VSTDQSTIAALWRFVRACEWSERILWWVLALAALAALLAVLRRRKSRA
jgi:MYXO-CTERM domain-containing protein